MDFPIIYPSSERTFLSLGLGVLKDAKDVKIRQVINGEYTLSLVLPLSSNEWQYIKEENIIYVNKQAFRIRRFDGIRDKTGKLTSNIQCEHVSYDLNDIKHLPNMRDIINVTPDQVFRAGFYDSDGKFIKGILAGTPFTFTSEDVGSTDLFLSKCNPRAVLNEFFYALCCEVVFDNFNISVVKKCGRATREVIFHPSLNLSEIKRSTDSTGLCTRLYPYGKDYLDITSVNAAKAYIDSPLILNYDYPHEDYCDYPDIETPSELKAKALAEWSTNEKDGIDKPKVTYELSVLELKKVSEYAEFKAFTLGDTVIVRDDDLGIDINARITEYEYYPYEAQRSKVVLQNFKQNIGGVFADITKNQNIIKQITNRKGEISDEFIESVKSTMSIKFNDALTKKTVIYDYANMWVDDLKNPTTAIALVNGMFAMANSKDSSGRWNWRTLADANGLVADSVISNWVYAGKIDATQINAGTINTDKITISSNSGNLKITSNQLEMKSQDNSLLTMSNNYGLKYQHEFDSYGNASKETVFNKYGVSKNYSIYHSENNTFESFCYEYVDIIYSNTLGGDGWPTNFPLELDGPQWCNRDKIVSAFVVPNETLRFVTPIGGRVDDLTDYTCKVDSIIETETGITVNIISKKTYVYSISNNNPVYRTGSMQFNVLVVLR